MINRSVHLSGTFNLNYSKFSNSSLGYKFAALKNLFDMIIDGIYPNLKQFSQLFLTKPDRLVLKTHLQLRSAVISLINENLRSIPGIVHVNLPCLFYLHYRGKVWLPFDFKFRS
jgi:hypothetical protein